MPRLKKLAVLLTPGASGGPDNPQLVAVDRVLAEDGVAVTRMGFRSRGGRAEKFIGEVRDGARTLATQAGVNADRVVLGGRSMGGRVCSLAVSDGLPAAGLALISYPLHAPGRPADARTTHFPDLSVPCLFVSGTRDAFGSPEELEAATAAIPGAVTHVWIDGGDHSISGKDAAVASAVREWVAALRSPSRAG